MKITIEQYEHTVTHEVPFNDVDLDEAVRMCEGLLKAIGYCFSGSLEIVDDISFESGEPITPLF